MQVAATHTLKIALLLALHGEACHPSNGRSNNRVNLPWPNNKLGYGRYSSLRICLRNNLATAKQKRRIGWGPKSRLHTDVPVLDQQWPDGGRMKRHFGSVAVCPWETCARLSRVAGRLERFVHYWWKDHVASATGLAKLAALEDDLQGGPPR